MLPTTKMKTHIANSSAVFKYEGLYYEVIHGMQSTGLDNVTDGLMYATAIHPGSGDAVQDALHNARYQYNDINIVNSLNVYACDEAVDGSSRYEVSYPRYWHGYLIVLKPMLLFLEISEIRMLNMFVQTILLFLLLCIILKKFGASYTIPIIMMELVLNPVALPLSLQFSWVYYISLIGALILLVLKYPPESDNYLILFMAIGMVTSYFDLLTYPLITLGLPLVLWLLKAGELKQVKRIKSTILSILFWMGGYAVMWAGKWVFAYLFGHDTYLFTEVINEISFRTSMTGDVNTPITYNILFEKLGSIILDKTYIFMFGCVLLGYIIWFVCECRRSERGRIDLSKAKLQLVLLHITPYVLVALLPFAWFVILSNHTYIHAYFTYRELAVTALAVGTVISECVVKYKKGFMQAKDI